MKRTAAEIFFLAFGLFSLSLLADETAPLVHFQVPQALCKQVTPSTFADIWMSSRQSEVLKSQGGRYTLIPNRSKAVGDVSYRGHGHSVYCACQHNDGNLYMDGPEDAYVQFLNDPTISECMKNASYDQQIKEQTWQPGYIRLEYSPEVCEALQPYYQKSKWVTYTWNWNSGTQTYLVQRV
ncbi:MAG: hypothetical protein K2X47_00070, partial [Bdellovibrionales bacterium]|nr:hypothetical protein [Bdellovibrionales bacterium]